jgi:predicted amidohydrolase
MRVAACQLNSKDNKEENIRVALELLDKAAGYGADIAVLPEYTDFMGDNAGALAAMEQIPGPLSDRIAAKAREHKMWVLLGSMHAGVEGANQCANTSILFDRDGNVATTYQKLHLYDVDLPGRVVYKESDTVVAGTKVVTADIEGIIAGLSICYDVRFPEIYRLQALNGAKILFVPAAFMLYTGRDHWELLLRARAVENQCFVVAAGQVGTYMPGKACAGRSMIIDPWGTVLATAPDTTGVIVADLDFSQLDKIRDELPSLLNRRPDIYSLGEAA